jgi:hypothetical protein
LALKKKNYYVQCICFTENKSLVSIIAIHADAGGSAILKSLASSAQAMTEHQNSSPSPTTILKSVNNSGHYMCSQRSKNMEMPSPSVIYHEPTTTSSSIMSQQSMMQHRNILNNVCHQDNNNQFEYDETDENSGQHGREQQYPTSYHNNNYNYSQSQSTQQQADQNTIELRMNNLGNEDTV